MANWQMAYGVRSPTLPSPSPPLEQELNTVIVIRIRERGQWEQDREGRRDGTEAMARGERIEGTPLSTGFHVEF